MLYSQQQFSSGSAVAMATHNKHLEKYEEEIMELMSSDNTTAEEEKSAPNMPLLPVGVTDSTGADMESLTSVLNGMTNKLNLIKKVIAKRVSDI